MKQSNSTEKVGTRHSYATYKRACKVVKMTPISESVYLKIINGLFKYIMGLIFDGHEVSLFQRTGTISIMGKKQNVRVEDGKIVGAAPDWVSTKKLWDSNPKAKQEKTLVYHMNEHTNGIRYKIRWHKRNIMTENGSLYSLKFSWGNKRIVNKLLLEGKEYTVIL